MAIGSLPGLPGLVAVPDPRLGPEMERLLGNLGKTFPTIPLYETAVIQHVQMDGLGRPAYAITDKGYRLDLSLGTPIREQEEWVIRGEGGPAGRRWQALYRSNSHGDLLGPIAGRFIPPPLIPSALYGGVVSAEQGNSTTDPGGASLASVTVYPRAISVSGNYDVYFQHFPVLHWRSRVWGSDDWSKVNSLNFHPASPIYLTLNGPVLADSLSWNVTPDPDANAEIEFSHLLFWLVDGEAVVGAYDGAHLTISQRGVDGTAAAAHSDGARIELASLRLPLTDFAQNTHYEMQFSFGGSFAEVGVWSDSIDFITFAITARPAPPTGLIVDLNNDEFELRWTPPPDASVKQFHVYRYDAPAAPGNGSYAPPAGATDLGIVAGHTFTVGANGVHTGLGHNFGVASRNNSGLESTITWNNDTWVPVSPLPGSVNLVPIPSGIRVTVGDTSALNRSGFKRYKLWQATSPTATIQNGGAWNIYDFPIRTAQGDFAIPQYQIPYYYQVTSENWVGAYSEPVGDAAHWLYCPSLLPSEGYPQNGNFQLPAPDGATPLHWDLSYFYISPTNQVIANAAGAGIAYENVGGAAGNYCIRCSNAGSMFSGGLVVWKIEHQLIVPYNRLKTFYVTLYFKYSYQDPSLDLRIAPYVWLYGDALGTTPPQQVYTTGPYEHTVSIRPDADHPYPINFWTLLPDVELLNYAPGDSSTFTRFGIEIIAADNGGGLAQPFDVRIDDVTAVADAPRG